VSQIQKSVELLAETLQSKNRGYTGGRGEFFNFEKAAEFACVSPLDVVMCQIGIKLTRLQGLLSRPQEDWDYAAIQDTLLDLGGYAMIGHARVTPSANGENLLERIRDAEADLAWNPAG
jgi:hypothetical protein